MNGLTLHKDPWPRSAPPLFGSGGLSRLMQLVSRTGARLDASGRAQLEGICKRLEHLCATSESDFLHLGGQLERFTRQAREIQLRGRKAADLLGGAEITATIGRLDAVLREVERQLQTGSARVDQMAATLVQLSGALRTAAAPLQVIGNSVMALRMLSTTTRSESARLGRTEEGFENLTTKVSHHSQEIRERMEGMQEELQILNRRIAAALQRMAAFRLAQANDLGRVIVGVQESVQKLRTKQAAQGDAVGQIAERSEHLVRAVGEVVASLQYHDITRQQMEHVRDSLADGLAGAAPTHLNSFLGLQASQLVGARDDLLAALAHAFGSLRGVGTLVQALAHQMDAAGGPADGRCADLLEALRLGFADAILALQNYGEMTAQVKGLLDELTTSLSAMGRFSAGVEGIGYDIRIIALNTAVKAAHLGLDGAALNVVASLVGGLSSAVMTHAADFKAAMGQIEDFAGQLHAQAGLDGDAPDRVGALGGDLMQALSQSGALIGAAMDEFDHMDAASGSLAEEIENLLEHLDTQGTAQREVAAVLDLLRRVARAPTLEALLLGVPGTDDPSWASLASGYTTSNQRLIHKAWLERRHPGDDKAATVALHATPPGGAAGTASPSQESLGDNVELF